MTCTYQPEGLRIASPENRDYLSSLSGLERAMRDGVILEGLVTLQFVFKFF